MKAKEINRDEDSDMVAPSEDTERLDGKAISRSTRQWANISDKMPVCGFISFCLLFIEETSC